MNYTLEIELGNDNDGAEGPYLIKDINGNVVGKWEVTA